MFLTAPFFFKKKTRDPVQLPAPLPSMTRSLFFFFLFVMHYTLGAVRSNQDYFSPQRVVYFLHMHKAGGTKLCSIAKEIGHIVVGLKNCGPTFPNIDGEKHAKSLAATLASRSGQKDSLDVVHCIDRKPPDKCNPWLRPNPLDMLRIWPMRKDRTARGRQEVEIPVWAFASLNEMDKTLESAGGPTFVANERYISPADEIRLHTSQDETEQTGNVYCYVAMFREPINRAYSHWKHDDHSNVDLPKNTNLDSYLQDYAQDNLMTRSMCGQICKEVDFNKLTTEHYARALKNVQALDVILLTESYEESLHLLEHKCPTPRPPEYDSEEEEEHENSFLSGKESNEEYRTWTSFARAVSLHQPTTNARRSLSPRRQVLLERLIEINYWDIRLFTEARKLFYHDLFMLHHKSLANVSKRIHESFEHEERRSRFYRPSSSLPNADNHNRNRKSTSHSGEKLKAVFVAEYDALKPFFAPLVGVQDHEQLRVKFPSLFLSPFPKDPLVPEWMVALNVRNDAICEGYFVTAQISASTLEYSKIDASNKKSKGGSRVRTKPLSSPLQLRQRADLDDEARGELIDKRQGISVLGFDFFRGGKGVTYTGAEDGRVITSPSGNRTYFVFNAKTPNKKRQMAVIDYAFDPGHAVFLTLHGSHTRHTEKNWTPFFLPLAQNKQEILHFVYTIEPTVILRCSDLARAIVQRRDKTDCDIISGNGETPATIAHFGKNIIVRGSSPLVEYEWPHYVGLVHSRAVVLEGKRKGSFWKPCYRTMLIVMDMKQGLPVHLSDVLEFPPKFVRGLGNDGGRKNAQDTYNHYSTSLYRFVSGSVTPQDPEDDYDEDDDEDDDHEEQQEDRWYFGVDFDDCHPVVGELVNMHEYMETHKYSFAPFAEAFKDDDTQASMSIHDVALSKPFIKSCPQERMKTVPPWARRQGQCSKKSGSKPRLPWKEQELFTGQ